MPSREDLLAWLARNPGAAGKRDIARAFGITGSAKIALKHLLRDLESEGVVEKRRKRLAPTGMLAQVFVADVTRRDPDGELLAVPDEWDEDERGPAPLVLVLAEPRVRRAGPKPPAAGVGDRLLLRLSEAEVELPEGVTHAARIVRVLERQPAAALGIVRLEPDGGARIVPIDKKSRELIVGSGDLGDAQDGDLVAVDLLRSGGRLGLSRAKVRSVVGSMASERAVSEIALHVHKIPHVFPASVLVEAEACRPVTGKGREDWRHLPLITIDPHDAKDHDDAVHAVADDDPANPGGVVVTVAIADVAHYVQTGSALDREALHRGNSVYFPDRVVPMLPERISTDLCSLREKEDRPALAVRMVFAAGGRKLRHSFHRILMRSAAKLAYAQAQAAIDGRVDDKTDVLVEGVLKPLWAAYEVLKKGRAAREPLDLDLPERKILLKPDGTVDRVIVPERLDAHKLIEEFMIQANVAAAETLEAHRVPLLYRIHDIPSEEKVTALKEFLSTLDIKLAARGGLRPSNFNAILAKVADTPKAGLVNEVVLRSQAQAEYNPANLGHFGLNLRRYAHFTSPIRRYADLIVHRALIRALKMGDDGLPEAMDAKLEAIGAEISACERRAMAAERETIDRLIARWLMDRIGASFAAKISGVTKSGLFVRLDETGADGFVPAATLGDDYYVYDQVTHAMIGSRTGETHRLGDVVEVKLVEAQPFAGALRFEILSEGSYDKVMGRKRLAAAQARQIRGAPKRGRVGPPRRS
ncbi:ribonuclease R [Siculibacillus lacustris]|uniref:Ribonuclease R n=1 Tax=Siculibacillus lacustris TaxID=1549641 RepID=A0A4Q9VHI6_9HYPH|nr:ribonuclease R [Siculibacillus lacustris]TBW34319.1 ribonuclease R [Siculibacillus lacustris]